MPDVQCLAEARCLLAESPVWDGPNNRLYWCDILAGNVHALDLATGCRRQWHFEGTVGSLGLARSGRLVVAVSDTVHLFDHVCEELTPVARVLEDWPTQRLNDGKVGPDGAFWVGSMDNRFQKRIAALYRVTADGQVQRKIEGVKVSNGLAWSSDGRMMFHSDSRGPWIDRWDFDPDTGGIAGRRRVCVLAEEDGRPDGGATDVRDTYWSAGVSAGCLNCFDVNGHLRERIELPIPAPTMACFGGSDMRTLFVTSMREGLSAQQLSSCPQSGGIFMLQMDVAGVPVTYFAD